MRLDPLGHGMGPNARGLRQAPPPLEENVAQTRHDLSDLPVQDLELLGKGLACVAPLAKVDVEHVAKMVNALRSCLLSFKALGEGGKVLDKIGTHLGAAAHAVADLDECVIANTDSFTEDGFPNIVQLVKIVQASSDDFTDKLLESVLALVKDRA
eukprot:8054629-Alexandrium_andersonii.AAC.1